MLIGIKVVTEAKEEKVEKQSDSRYVVSLKEPPEDNRANKRLMEIMRGLHPGTEVKIVSGHHMPHKIVEVAERR